MIDNVSGIWYFYHYDGLGSVMALSKFNGSTVQIVERYRYDAFGQTEVLTAAYSLLPDSQYANPYRFTARRWDDESALYYYRARMVSAKLGRFLQTDPIGYADSMNAYQYCLNSPTNYIDPWGLESKEDGIGKTIGKEALQNAAEEVGQQVAEKMVQGPVQDTTADECIVAAPGLGIHERIPPVHPRVLNEAREKAAKVAAKKAKRLKYLGKNPSKTSRTGREVIDRMKKEGKIRMRKGRTQFKAGDNKWYDIKRADMAHRTDAVEYWNTTGRKYGPKSKEVREWMLDSENYYLELDSINRSQGARLGKRYLDP